MDRTRENNNHDTEEHNTKPTRANKYPYKMPTVEECKFFSSGCIIFSKIGHMLDHKTDLNKFKHINLIQSKLCSHSDIVTK